MSCRVTNLSCCLREIFLTLAYLSQFLRQAVNFHLEAVGALVGCAAGVQGVVHIGVHRLEVGLHASLVAGQCRHVHGQLVDASRRFVQLAVGVLARPLCLHTSTAPHQVLSATRQCKRNFGF